MAKSVFGKGIIGALGLVCLLAQDAAAERRRGTSKVFIPRFQFTIEKSRIGDLLPVPPKAQPAGPLYPNKLTDVPEVMFEEMPVIEAATPAGQSKHGSAGESKHSKLDSDREREEGQHGRHFMNMQRLAHTIAKINHLNKERTDYFMHVLLDRRPDLAGLPFVMGDACRLKKERNRPFSMAVANVQDALTLRQRLQDRTGGPIGDLAESFWTRYEQCCKDSQGESKRASEPPPCDAELLRVNRIAALMQMLGPQSAEMRQGLVKHLAGIDNVDATRALAKLAVFSPEDKVRLPALEALKTRKHEDYTAIVVDGLRYPWPAVAARAADAVAKLKRTDLAEQLVDVLDQPDPRDPYTEARGKQEVTMVRHLVRINHHRNCLLCHAPGNTPDVKDDVLTSAMPVPGDAFQSFGSYGRSPDILVRADVTYLRQDFSEMHRVEKAAPWPEMQRFDFLVRTRALSETEAEAYRTAIAKRGDGYVSPYHRAVGVALRELTGREAELNAAAWRRVVESAR